MPDAMPHNVLPTVFGHCTPRFGGKRRLPRLHSCTPPLLVTIKGGGGLPLDSLNAAGHQLLRSPTFTIIATLNSFPSKDLGASSLSRLACTPYYKHSGCRIIQCPRTPPLLDVRPRGRNQDKPCVTVLPLASSFGTRKHASFPSWDPDPRVGTSTCLNRYIMFSLNVHLPRCFGRRSESLWGEQYHIYTPGCGLQMYSGQMFAPSPRLLL